jgi:kinetochore protein NDC80
LQRNEKHAPKKLVTDPRNVKDPEVQRRYLRNITDYLQETNYKGTPPPQNIRALSNKNFEAIFKHLVARLMPSHRYKRKFEEDAMEILRFLNYALVETISAKSFLSIGALHSNPQFFGILHWLVECCKAKDIIPEPEEEEESLPSVNGQDGLSILFHEYALATYHVYMNGSDDYNEPNQELKEVFGNLGKKKKKT